MPHRVCHRQGLRIQLGPPRLIQDLEDGKASERMAKPLSIWASVGGEGSQWLLTEVLGSKDQGKSFNFVSP